MKKNIFFVFLLFGSSIFFYSCSIWKNFTAYYNLFYNASLLYEEAENNLLRQKTDILAFEEPTPNNQIVQSLNKVIEKCSKILQFHNQSNFVDDALLLIGKSYYYQKSYLQAIRKFAELEAKYPNSNFIAESKLFSGKTKLQLEMFDEGLNDIAAAKEKAKLWRDYKTIDAAFVALISYSLKFNSQEESLKLIQNSLDSVYDKTTLAVLLFKKGSIEIKIQNFEKARESFCRAEKLSKDINFQFQCELQLAKINYMTNNYREAEGIIKEMLSKKKYKQYFDMLELELGKSYLEEKRIEEAKEQFIRVDTLYKNTKSASFAKFYLAQIYEKNESNLSTANNYYKSIINANIDENFKTIARQKNVYLNKYEKLKAESFKLRRDSLYLQNPEKFIEDSIKIAVENRKIDSVAKIIASQSQQQSQEQSQTIQRGRDRRGDSRTSSQTVQKTETGQGRKTLPQRPNISADSVNFLLTQNYFELANLFLLELNYPDSAYYYYNLILNSFKENSFTPYAKYSLAMCYSSIGDSNGYKKVLTEIYEKYPQSDPGIAAAQELKKKPYEKPKDPAEEKYANAEKLTNEKNYGKAVEAFWKIYNDHKSSPLAPKALYAAGWISENKLLDMKKAAAAYDTLNRVYPSSEYSREIMIKIGNYRKAELEQKNKQDTIKTVNEKKLDIGKDLKIDADTENLDQNLFNDAKSKADSLRNKESRSRNR